MVNNSPNKYVNQLLSEDELKKLNRIIDLDTHEMDTIKVDWDMIEKTLTMYLQSLPSISRPSVRYSVPMSREEIVGGCLKFFRSTGDAMYQRVLEALTNKNDNLIVHFYNHHDYHDYNERNEFGHLKYTRKPNVNNSKNKVTLNMPLKSDFDKRESRVSPKETDLEDMFSLVHEVGHTLDLNFGENKKNMSRELLGEATAMSFELLLGDYLLRQSEHDSEAIKSKIQTLFLSGIHDAEKSVFKIKLSKAKKKKILTLSGKITNGDLMTLCEENKLPMYYVRNVLMQIIHNPVSLNYMKRYALGIMISPIIALKMKEDGGEEKIDQYFSACKEDDFQKAISAIGISLDDKSMQDLMKNGINYISSIFKYERPKEIIE